MSEADIALEEPADSIGTTDEDVLLRAKARMTRALDAEMKNRDHALECLKFRNLEQWNPEVKQMREKDPEGARPCLVVDKTNQYLRQVINDERQNRPAIKVRPVDDKGDPEVAEVLQGIVRHIEDQSGAALAYDTAYEAAVDGGFGYFRLVTEYCDPLSFEQDIRIKRIRNRFTVLLDSNRQEPDGSDSTWGFVIEKMPRGEFKRAHPKSDQMDFMTDGKVFNEWVFKDYVIVAEYFEILMRQARICQWASGRITEKPAGEAGKLYVVGYVDAMGDAIIAERETQLPQVKWYKLTANDVLERRDIPGRYIPIVEVIGNELDIEGERITSGLLKGAMEPQKIHNYAASSFVETVMLAPRAPWVAAEGQIEGYEELYRTANRRSITVLPYKPVVADGNVPVPPPTRVAPPGLSVGWQQTMINTEHDVQASMGMYNASLGADSNEKSGIALQKKQREADTATFHYYDNLQRSIRQCGRIVLGWIPVYYDTKRVARILGEDGTTDEAMLDPTAPQAVTEIKDDAGAIQKIYNPTIGRYDVAVTTGPSYTTKRQEAADHMVQVIQAAPDLMKVGGDIMFRNMDWPGADEMAKRLKMLLPPQVKEMDEGEPQPMVPTPMGPVPLQAAGQMIGEMQQAGMAMQEELKKGEVAKAQKEALAEQVRLATEQNRAAELANDDKRIELERFQAQTERMKAMADAEKKDAEIKQMIFEAVRDYVDRTPQEDSGLLSPLKKPEPKPNGGDAAGVAQ